MKINATTIDIVLLFFTVAAGLSNTAMFAIMFMVSAVWFTVHVSLSRKTFKELRKAIHHSMFG